MNKYKNVLMTAIISVSFNSVFAGATLAGAALEAPDFRAEVVGVDNAGIVYFEGNGGYRLWGLIPDSDYLRELLVGRTLACYVAGELKGRWRGISATTRTVVCRFGLLDPQPKEGLVKHLLQTGHATEFCAETLGLFGTCPAGSFD